MRDLGGHRGRGLAKTIDWKLVICYLLLILIGWVNIYAAVQADEPTSILTGDAEAASSSYGF